MTSVLSRPRSETATPAARA